MKRLTLFMPSLGGGGAERVAINLLKGLDVYREKLLFDLVLCSASGPLMAEVPPWVNVIDLGVSRVRNAILPLARYLRKESPDCILAHQAHANLVAAIAHYLSKARGRLFVVEHNSRLNWPTGTMLGSISNCAIAYAYRYADRVVGVSQAVTDDLIQYLRVPSSNVTTIYNPVVSAEVVNSVDERAGSKQLFDGRFLLAVGRLTRQKDFASLLNAFAAVARATDISLIILGDGPQKGELLDLARELGIANNVDFRGFVKNPYEFMKEAAGLVLSSRWEGLPTVLIEAMACGCPVVSTDCPGGSREILENGIYGELVRLDDISALTAAMYRMLEKPIPAQVLKRRAMDFSIESATCRYMAEMFPDIS